MTKKELIHQEQTGNLVPIGACTLTNTSAAVICYIDGEKVFGYLTSGETKDYFYTRLKHLNDDSSFRVGSITLRTSNFMRV